MLYGWTLDYVLDKLTLSQVMFFFNQASLFFNPESDDNPDKEKFHRLYGNEKKVSR